MKASRVRMYGLRVHSLRKFFRAQMAALGVPADYIEYMMGHTVDTYHDIQSLGVERLMGIYASAGLAIRPKTKVSKIEALKEIIRAWGMKPEQILTMEALSQGAATHEGSEGVIDYQLQILTKTLKDLIPQEVVG